MKYQLEESYIDRIIEVKYRIQIGANSSRNGQS
jgi:hypothetical protein